MAEQFITIDQLHMGTSGQAPWQRRAGHVEASENVRHDIAAGGAAWRGPSELIADLESFTSVSLSGETDFYWTQIRDAIVAIGDGVIHGWNENGVALEVVQVEIDVVAGATTKVNGDVPAVDFAYIAGMDPIDDIRVSVMEDSIIVANRLTECETTDPWTFNQVVQYIMQDNTAVASAHATPEVSLFSDLPTTGLGGGKYVYVTTGENQDPSGWYMYVGSELDSAGEEVNRYPGLPVSDYLFPQHGDWFRIPGDVAPRSDKAERRWNPLTMPHRIIYDQVNARLIWDVCPWRHRVSGNTGSNEDLPLADRTIRAVEFFEGRLSLITNRNVNGSRRNDFFNLFLHSVNAPADNDRFSVDIVESDLGRVLRSKVVGSGILIVSENGQVQFRPPPDQVLTNTNGTVKRVTSFQAQDVEPGGAQSSASIVDHFKDVHYYEWLNEDAGIAYLSKLTVHYPKALFGRTPLRLFHNDRTIFVTTDLGPALSHDLFFIGGDLIQSAWGVLDFYESPVFFGAWRGNIRVVTKDGDEGYSLLHYIHREQEPPTELQFTPHLDRMERLSGSSLTYDTQTNETVILHTGRDATLADSRLVDENHVFYTPKSVDGAEARFAGDLTALTVWLGFKYRRSITLTRLWPGPTRRGLRTRSLNVLVRDTTDVNLTVTLDDSGNVYEEKKQFHRVDITLVDAVTLKTGYAAFPVAGDPRIMSLELWSESQGPGIITAVEYEVEPLGRGAAA